MSEICRMCGKERSEHQGGLESCFGPMDERNSCFAPQLDNHPVEELLALARSEERKRCARRLRDYWNTVDYCEFLDIEDAIKAIDSAD